MSSLLAQRGDQFFLAAFAGHLRGCNLSTVQPPRLNPEMFHRWRDKIWVWSHAQPGDVRFFPTIRFRGCKVIPYDWADDTTAPRLIIFMDSGDLDLERFFVKPPINDPFSIRTAMIADGWSWDLREGGHRIVHVDELEKIEGPPPEGAF